MKKLSSFAALLLVSLSGLMAKPMDFKTAIPDREFDPVSAATVPYSCSFADATENASWVLLNGSDTNRWVIGYAVNSGNNNMGALYVSSDEGLSNFYLTNETSTVFAYRDITLTAGQYAYSYDWYAMGETGRDYLRVALVPSTVTLTGGTLGAWSENTLPAGALAMDGGHWLSGAATWQTANDVVDVPTSGTYRIVVLWHNDDRYGDQMPAAIDNITFEENTCVLPTQLTFSSVTSTGAVLTWQAGGSESIWEVTVNGTTHTVSNTPTFTFTGLQPNTDYQVELRSVCGNTRSLAARRTTFRTACANRSLPYSYGFEDAAIGAGSEMPTCWTRISATSFPYVVQNNPHGGSRALYFNNQLQYAVLPAFDIADISTMKVGFWARKVANGAISVVVGMMTNPNDATTFVPVDTVDDITVSYARYEVNMGSYNGTGSYPALMVPATGANYLYIDDINVSACTYVVTAQTPLTETFEAVTSVTRNCWTQETVNGNLAWTFRQGGNSNIPSTSHSGTSNAYFYGTSNQRNYKTRLVSPILNTSSMNTVRMSFWHAQAKWGGDQDTLKVYYRQAPSQPWELLAVYSDDITTWTLHELYMLGADSMQVAFLGIARNGRGVVLDDITFDEAPYCGEVLSLSAQLTDTLNSTARLTWNGSLGTGAYFRLEYGPQGFTPGNGTVVNNITTTSYDVPYLGVGITYDFYVTTICNSVQQSARVMTSLYIPAVVDTTMPYYTSFDNASDVTRWVLLNGTQANRWTIGTATGNYTTTGGALYITNNGSDNTYDNNFSSSVFAYRALRLRAGNYTYRYDWRAYGESSYDYLRVALVPDTTTLLPGSATGWTSTAIPDGLLSLDGNSRLNLQNSWQSREGRFMIETEGVYHLVFFWCNDGNTGTQPPAAIDNITIDRLPDMDVVTELPYQCDFSDILENARWTLANGTQTNQWAFGSAAGSYPTGSNALYISNNSGSDNAYSLGTTTSVYAYRTFLLDSGSYDYSYSWRANGEVGTNGTHYDYLRVAIVPASITPVAGSTGNWTATSVPSGYTSIDGEGPLDNHMEWQQAYGRFEIAEEGLYHMVFFWHNDNSSGSQPPAAVDNIVLQPSDEACGTVSNLVTTAVQDTSVTLSWNGTGNLYRIEYGPANFVPGTGTLLNNIPTRAYTVTGLTPATNYDFYVSIVCGQLPLGASPLRITVATRSQIEGLPYVCDFSDANENANWTLLNGTQTNKWFIGTATGNGDTRALYISNDNGVNNNYTLTATSTVFAYRPFHLDAGRYAYSYDWKTVGETSYDFIRAVVVPSTINLSAGNASGFGYNTLPNGAVALDGGEQLVGSADWRTVTGTFDITATGDYYLLFYWRNDNSTGTQPPAAIDNVMLQSDDCEMPSELAVAAIDDGSVTFTWFTSMGSAWQVSCGSLVDTVYTRRATFTGLQSNTTYRLFVRTLCEDGVSGRATLEVHTPCAARALPYSYDFEDATAAGRNGQINACWLKGTDVPSTAGYPYPSNTYSHGDGLYSMYMASSNTYSSYLVLPLFDNPVNRTVLTFWARPNSTTTSYPLEIGVVTNPVDISTFELVETYVIPNATVDWYKDTVLFDTYQGTGRFIAIRLQGGTARYCYLDDFTVEVMPECSGVTDIAVASTTENSIQLTWHETGPATSWMVEYGPEGFVPGAGTAMAVQDTVVTITGLANNTYYDFYIHSDCGHATSIARRITAQTDCGRMSIPFMETFDSYRGNATDPIDHCWYKVYRQGNNIDQLSYPQFTIQGSNTYLSFYSNTNNYSYLALPLMEGNIHDQMLRFKMRSSGTAQAVIRVGVMTDATNYSTFQQVSQVTNTSGNWETYTVPFSSRTGTSYRIALLSPAQSQTNQPLVDDIEVLAIPACSSPTNFMVTNITTTGARLTWTAPTGITHFRVVYRPYGDYDSSYEVTVDSLQGTSYTITGLQAGTTYEAEVYSYCVSDEESFSLGATTTFSTSCTAFPIPFSESFDRCIASNAAPIGPCWYKRYASNNSQNSYPFPTITNAKYDGDKTLVFYGGNGNNAYSYVVLPELSGTLSQMQISLKLRTPNRTSSMIVGVVSDPSNINTFQQVQTLTTTSTTEWQSFTVPFTSVSATNVRIAIRQATNAQQASTVYLDDILVEAIPVCNGPAQVTVDRVLCDRVRVHWPASTTTGATYTVEYGPAGFTLGQGTRLTGLTDTSVNLTGLAPASAYTVYVQTACSSTSQSALVSNTFTTGCLEQVPYSYGFEVLTSNGNTTNVPCWVLGNNARVYRSSTQANYAAEGTCRLQFSISGTGNSAYAVMPKLSDRVSDLYMTLKYMSTAGSSNLLCPLQVGIMTDPYDFSTFTAVTTLTPTTATWEPFRVDFGNQSGDGYIAFYAINNQYVPTVAIDDIHVYRVTPHQINLTVAEPTRGTVSINGVATNHAQVLSGSTVTLAATPNYGYSFGHWTAGVTANPYVFTMPDRDVTYNNVTFVKNAYTVTATANNNVLGTVVGSGSYDYLDTATLVATPYAGYLFIQWSDGSTANPRRLVVSRDTTLTAQFSVDCITLEVSIDSTVCESLTWNGTTYTGSGTYTHQDTTIWGCDSITTLHLTVLHGTHNVAYDTSDYDIYAWHGTTYTATGVYSYQYINDDGCASTDTLHLVIDPTRPVLVDETHPFHDDFERGNCWRLLNGTVTNKWYVGSATNNGGTKSLYISNNNGVANEYSTNTSCAVFAAKTFTLTAGHHYFSYDWRGFGESTYDYMRVALAPASANLTPGTSTYSGISTTQLPSGWITLDGGSKRNLSNGWQSYVAEATVTTVGNYQMVFYWRNDNLQGTQPPAAVDNVSIIKSNCDRPTDVAASNISLTTATLTWSGSAGSYQVAYGTATAIEDMDTLTANGTTLQLSNLSPSAIYRVYVKSVCSATDQSPWSELYTFSTACGPMTTLPYTQGFEESATGSNTFEVNCWSRHTSAGSYPYVSNTSTYVHSGSNGLYWYATSSYTQYLVLPEMNTTVHPINTLRMKFWAKANSGTTLPAFLVGVMTNPDDLNTFTVVATINVSGTTWIEYTANLGNYTGAGSYIAVRAQATSSWAVFLDDFTLEEIPSCPEPTGVGTTTVTNNSAMLSWLGTGASSYTVAYGMGTDVNTMDTLRVYNTTATLTSLNPGSEYHAYVRANCADEQSAWTQIYTFRTQCGQISVLPYTEDFNTSTTGSATFGVNCWQRISSATYPYVYATAGRNGNGLYWNYPATAGAYQYAVLPAIDVTQHPISTLRLTFWARSVNSTYHPRIEVGVMSNPLDISTFTLLRGVDIEGVSWTEHTIDLNAYSGNGQNIALRGANTSGSQWYAYLDDFTVDVAPACVEPYDVAVANVTATTATFSWQGSAQSYTVAYGTDTVPSAMTTRTTTSTTLGLSGLLPNTEYHIFVRSECVGGSHSEWTPMYTFHTECMAIASLPFTEGFEDYDAGNINTATFPVACWRRFTNGANYYVPVISSQAHTGRRGLQWYLYNYASYGTSQYVVLPSIEVPGRSLNALQLTFWARVSSPSVTGNFQVGVMTDPNDTNTFTQVGTLSVTGTAWTEYTTELASYSGMGTHIALRSRNTSNSGYAYMDDFTVSVTPTCFPPTGITIGNITSNSATVSWSGTSGNYVVAYGTGTSPEAMDSVTVTTSTTDLTYLIPNTTYNLFIRSVCGDERSVWSEMYTFTTECELLTIPYVEDFESYNTTSYTTATFTVPCWHRVSNGTSAYSPYVSNNSAVRHAGNRGLYWNMAGTAAYGTSQYVILPGLDTSVYPTSRHQLSFWARANTTAQRPVFLIGVMSNPNDTTTFVPVDTLNITTNAWTQYTFLMENYTGHGNYMAICARANSGWVAGMDDLSVTITPICFPPTDIATGTITTNSATLSWTGTSTSYKIAYGIGSDPDAMDSVIVTGNSATLMGLSPATTYNVFFQGICGNERSAWSSVFSFTTACGLVSQLPLTQGFEGRPTGNLSTPNADFGVPCWTHLNNGTRWMGTPYISGNLSHIGTRALYWQNDTYVSNDQYGDYQVVVLPGIDASVLNIRDLRLKFWSFANTGNPVYHIGVMTNPNNINTYTEVATINADSAVWKEYHVDLYFYTANGSYVAIRINQGTAWTAYMDDITLDYTPPCALPTNVTAGNVTSSTATITWTGTEAGYRVAYGTGTDIATMDSINVTGTTTTLTGLMRNTDYHVYVRALCPYGNSEWSPMVTFHTPCGVIPSVVTTDVACESYTWHGQSYTTSNTYTFDTLIDGCTRTDTLHLTINHSTTGDTTAVACENFTWYDSSYSSSTSVSRIFTNAAGCDSVVTLHLTVNYGTYNSQTEMVNESYTWHETTYTATGLYTYNYTNGDGCPSTDTLHLTVDPYMPILVNETHPFSDGFEGNILHWQLFNGTLTNKWARGTAAHSNGDNALYISNNNGTSNAYTTSNATSAVFATKKFILPAGHFYFSYDWRCMAENDYDYLRVYLTPANTTFTAGTLPTGVSTTGTPTGWTVLDRGSQMNMSSSWGNYAAEVNITDSAIYQVVFLWYNDSYTGTQPPAAIDEVTFVKSDCARPANVAVQDVTRNTATLNWTGTAGSYQVAYGTTSVLSEMDTVTVTGNSVTLTDLAHTTTHYVYVRALCSDTDPSAWSPVISFRTACGPVALPYNYGFEDASRSGSNGTINECWHKGSSAPNSSNYPYPYNYYSHEGNYSMYMVAEASYYSYVVLPQFDTTLSRTQLTFWGRAVSSSYASTVEIGVVTNPTDISTFQLYTTFEIPRTGVLQWLCDTVMFDTYQGNGQYIAIRLQGGGNARCYLDDFTVEAMPECSGVRNIAVVATTDTSVTLSWHETGAATSWGIEYGPQGFVQGSGTLVTVTDTTATITGLTNNTWYDFYVHSDCVHATSRVQSIGVQTDCGRMAIPFYEGFSDYVYSDDPINRCWYKRNSQNNSQTSYPQFNFYDNGNGCLNFSSTRNYYSYLVLPSMQGNIHDQMLRFKVRNGGDLTSSVSVGVMTDATNFNTFQQVDVIGTATMEWNTVTIPFNSLNGTNYRIAIVAPRVPNNPDVNIYSFYVDDIEVLPIPDCLAPEYLDVNNYTDTSVTVNWSAVQGVSYYRVVCTPHGDYDSTYSITFDSVTGTSLVLTGLRMGTRYDVAVYSLCVTGELSDPVTSPFSTLCTAHSVPFTENFDHYTALTQIFSPCWNNGSYGSTSNTYPFISTTNGKYEGDKILLFYSSSNTMYSYAILPELDDTLSLLQLKLQARAGNGNNQNISLQIGTVASSANITTFQTVQNVQLDGTWQYYTVPLTSVIDNSRRLAIRHQPNGGQGQAGNVLVDDIIVERIPACNGPARVTADHIVYNGARVHWPAVAGVASYTLEYGPSGFALGQGTQVTGITDTTYNLTGLTAGTAYSVYLSAACNSWNQSSLVTTSFSTGCLEELPYAYGFENLTTAVNGTVSTVPCWVLNENAQVQNNRNTIGYAAEGYARMRFSINRLTAYAVMPKLNERIENLYMTLQVNTPDPYFDEPRAPLQVGVMTDPYDFSTFTAVASLMPTSADSWQSFRVDFDTLTGDNYYIAFYATSTSAYVYNVYFDDIQVIRIAPHNIDLTLADSTRGTVSINGVATTHAQALSGSNVTLTATANHGYAFSHWAAGITDNPYTFIMPDHDVTYNHIVFSLNTYTVTALSNDTTLGTVAGGGRYDYLDTATLTATGNGIHTFLRWSDGVTDNPRTLVVTDDTTFMALFQNNCPSNVDTTVVVCDSYSWHDSSYTTTGLYTFDRSTDQCVIVDTLRLTVNHSTTSGETLTVCDSYIWHGTPYTATGVYNYHTINAAGCDSSETLDLTVNYSNTGIETVTVCDSYTWHGSTYTYGGTYYYDTLNAEGCDSLTTLTLTVNHSTHDNYYQNACDSYTWNNTNYTTSGTYTYNYINGEGCASTDTLHLVIDQHADTAYYVTVCDGYRWNDSLYTVSGVYTYNYSLAGSTCTNVDTLYLTINHSADVTVVDTACDSFLWNDSTYSHTGVYTYATTTAAGCDSVTTLHLTLNRSTIGSDIVTACDGYTWIDGNTYTASTSTPTSTLTAANGCDSVVTLFLTVNHSTSGSETHTACDSYTWHGTAYSVSGIYTYDYTSVEGCPSTDTLTLTINYSTMGSETVTVCDSYTWRGTTYTASGNYTFDTLNASGCDSTNTLHLTVNYSNTGIDTQTACESFRWINGVTYTSSTNTPTFTLTNHHRCDSVVTLNLTVNHNSTIALQRSVCDSIVWHGNTYTYGGTYYFDTLNAEGCDSLTTLTLTLNHSTHDNYYQNACDSYTWNNTNYTVTGIYTYDYTNTEGCASTDTLYLVVDQHADTAYHVTACNSYRWNDSLYTVSGVYTYNYSLAGSTCTNVDTLYLTINHSAEVTAVDTACDSYRWNDSTYRYTGVYTYATTTAAGCDSVTTLHLTINRSTTGADIVTACDQYTWINGITYTIDNNNVSTYTLTAANGCDSVVTLYLTLNQSTTGDTAAVACDRYTWYDSSYTSTTSATRVFTNVAGCDSTVTLHLTVNHSTTGDTTAVACDRFTWYDSSYTSTTSATRVFTNVAGCDSTVTLHLTINHSVATEVYDTACESYIWHDYPISSVTYSESGDYSYTATTTAGCDSTVTLHLTINHGTHDNYYQHACDTFLWHGTEYTLTGTYFYEYTNAVGCASADTLHLTVDQHSDTAYHVTVCDVYRWNDSIFTESGVYTYDYSLAGSSCTNVDTLYLTVNYSMDSDLYVTTCNSYHWDGEGIDLLEEWYRQSGTYVRRLQTVGGCDSTATLHLTLNHRSELDTTLVACDTLFWTVEDTTFVITESGDYSVVGMLAWTVIDDSYLELGRDFLNASGCDSSQTLHVTIHHATNGDTTAVACDSFEWYGTSYSSSTSVTRTTVNTAGCDSVVTLHLTVNYSTTGDTAVTACDSYTWYDSSYTSSTRVARTFTNAAGCDSVVTLNLILHHGSYTATYQASCDSFLWHDSLYTLSGTYVYDYLSPEGCPSTDTLVLTLSNGTSTGYHVDACDGYVWNGQRYTETGNYIYDYSMLGGDCENVDTLYLTIHLSSYAEIYDTACDSYLFGNDYLTESGIYYHDFTTAYGCDSVIALTLTLHYNTSTAYTDTIEDGEEYIWPVNGGSYTEEGTYLYEYLSPYGCASTDTLYLTVLHTTPVYHTLHARSADEAMGYVVLYPDSVALEGSVIYVIPVPHEGYRFVSWDNGDTNLIQAVILMSDTTITARFDQALGIRQVDDLADLTIYPNPTTGTVTLSAADVQRVEVYDNRGGKVFTVENSVTVDLTQLPAGVYMLRVTTPQGSAVRRVVKR